MMDHVISKKLNHNKKYMLQSIIYYFIYYRNYKYLGGSYGRVSESVIMSEIMSNGPVVLSFEPSYDFMYYE